MRPPASTPLFFRRAALVLFLWAARTVDLPIDPEEETLLDAVLTATDLVPERQELAHVEAERAADPTLESWMTAVCPGADAALRAAAARVRTA